MHRLAGSGIQKREGPTAEITIIIEEIALRLHAEETPGRTATGTTRITDLLAMTAVIEIKAGVEAGREIGHHTMEDLLVEK